ncbi:MAG: hypothetical protein II766_01865 [Paludibacteraceae bacterium]|jgi:drug/metabolite transporter (DMT)-like permease|nr:hypothetical protein [Paludibacteraceae bacterium]
MNNLLLKLCGTIIVLIGVLILVLHSFKVLPDNNIVLSVAGIIIIIGIVLYTIINKRLKE